MEASRDGLKREGKGSEESLPRHPTPEAQSATLGAGSGTLEVVDDVDEVDVIVIIVEGVTIGVIEAEEAGTMGAGKTFFTGAATDSFSTGGGEIGASLEASF